MEEVPVWVFLPAFPLHLWTMDVFGAIDNNLGLFLEANMSYLETKSRNLAHNLVRLDPREVLAEKIQLQLDRLSYNQTLDYERLPFTCHKHGHLA